MMPMEEPWMWLSAGVVLTLAEFAIPGFVICFFGVAAMLMAGVTWLCPEMGTGWKVLLYTVLSLVLLVVCRRWMPASFKGRSSAAGGDPDEDEVAGGRATVCEAIREPAGGAVECRWTRWRAHSADGGDIEAGAQVEVAARENLELKVRRI